RGFAHVHRQRFLADDMLARLDRRLALLEMVTIRRCDVNRADVRIGKQLRKACVPSGKSELLSCLLDPLRRGFNHARDGRSTAPPDTQPTTASHPHAVFLVAYPKSGITWLQAMVAGAIYGLDPQRAPDSLVQDLVPDVHYKRFYKRYRTSMFFKTHHLPRPEY